jgi:hypothetical protein
MRTFQYCYQFLSTRGQFQVKPAALLVSIGLFLFLRGGGVLQYPIPKWLLLLNQCGKWFSLPT